VGRLLLLLMLAQWAVLLMLAQRVVVLLSMLAQWAVLLLSMLAQWAVLLMLAQWAVLLLPLLAQWAVLLMLAQWAVLLLPMLAQWAGCCGMLGHMLGFPKSRFGLLKGELPRRWCRLCTVLAAHHAVHAVLTCCACIGQPCAGDLALTHAHTNVWHQFAAPVNVMFIQPMWLLQLHRRLLCFHLLFAFLHMYCKKISQRCAHSCFLLFYTCIAKRFHKDARIPALDCTLALQEPFLHTRPANPQVMCVSSYTVFFCPVFAFHNTYFVGALHQLTAGRMYALCRSSIVKLVQAIYQAVVNLVVDVGMVVIIC